jgi:hypothetical protein
LPATEHVMHMGGWRVKAEKFSLVKEDKKVDAQPTKAAKKEDEEGEGDEGSEESDEKEITGESNVAPTTPVSGTTTEYASEVILQLSAPVHTYPLFFFFFVLHQVLAQTVAPYFNRSWDHFTSHSHTPSSGTVVGPAAVFTPARRVIYFAHPIFTQFWKFSASWYIYIYI